MIAAIAAGAVDVPVMTKQQHRAHEFAKYIAPKVAAFGFDARFVRDGLPVPKDANGRAQATVLGMVRSGLKNEGAIIALCGPRGVGKTTLMAQIATERAFEDRQSIFDKADGARPDVMFRWTLYRKTTAIISKLKVIYADFGGIDGAGAEIYADNLVKCDVLVIDELQESGDDSRHKDRILTDIIDRRYSARRDTVLITNQTEAEFRATINTSILSRLGEHGAIIDCAWRSFRESDRIV